MPNKYAIALIAPLVVYLLGSFYAVSFDISQWLDVARFLAVMIMPFSYIAVVTYPGEWK